jgi:hypothetical protein
MLKLGFEPRILVLWEANTIHALDRVATVVGVPFFLSSNKSSSLKILQSSTTVYSKLLIATGAAVTALSVPTQPEGAKRIQILCRGQMNAVS